VMNIKPKAAGGYIALLLAIIAFMAGHAVLGRCELADICVIDPWQLIASELLLYVTVCYLWDRRSGALLAFIRAAGMASGRLGLSLLTAVGISRFWPGLATYSDAFAQAALASQPVVLVQVAYIVLVFSLPFRVLRRRDWAAW